VEPVTTRRSRPRSRTLCGIAALGLVLAGVAAGCGETVGYSEGGDRVAGRALFIEGCGSCHTLADAGTTAQIGPNLDYAFLQSRKDGLGESTIQQVVRGQIAYPVTDPPVEGAVGMPADIFTGQDADDVAAYVASVAGLDVDEDGVPDVPAGGGSSGGGGTEPGETDGKAIFASQGCGSCHALADANATGAVGPSLDESQPSQELVVERVTNGLGGMPAFADKLTAEQIDAVAEYVAGAAGS
jgi:mono/diheme cytochrome c family protein